MNEDGLTLLDHLCIKHERVNRMAGFFTWTLGRKVKWLVCFFVGHDVEDGEQVYDGTGYSMKITEDYCRRCFHDEKEMDLEYPSVTLPYYLNRLYVWLVEREWRWFDTIDEYVYDHHTKMPGWWSY